MREPGLLDERVAKNLLGRELPPFQSPLRQIQHFHSMEKKGDSKSEDSSPFRLEKSSFMEQKKDYHMLFCSLKEGKIKDERTHRGGITCRCIKGKGLYIRKIFFPLSLMVGKKEQQ
jgi:hypothetical protein